MLQTLITTYKIAYGLVFFAVSAILVKKFYSACGENRALARRAAFVVFFWYFFTLFLASIGFFSAPDKFSKGDNIGITLILIIMAVPLIVFSRAWRKDNALKQLTESISPEFFINMQIYRLLGGYYILLLINNSAPAFFALPTGIFDIALGIMAPIVAYRLSKRSKFSVRTALIWNYASLMDFTIAFCIYFLYFPFKILEISPAKIMWAGFYPVAFVVMFVVPLSVIFYYISINKLNKQYAK